MTVFARATPGQQEDAHRVWSAARTEAGNPPPEGRGYSLTNDVKHLGDQEIVRYELKIEGQ